jgi:3-hydroxybutyryl-CoA dehydrogenase
MDERPRAAVIGGGTMGAGIAHVLLAAGAPVTMVDTDDDRVAAARDAVATSLAGAAERGKLPTGTSADDLLARLDTRTDVADLPADTALVVEAVPERLELKQTVLGTVATTCPDAILASNTSSLSIGAIATALPGERVIGMHFFNPVPAQKLVEIVEHPGTAEATTTACREWVDAIGKTPIVVADAPGFATSRLGVAVGLEAIRMVEEGVATAEDIDTGMQLGYRWPMGPLRLGDVVGLDVRLDIAEHLARELGPRFEPPALLRTMVERGDLGKKSGRGFYDWS